MPTLDIQVPQLGEGLQEVRILKLLKRPRETIEKDEPIYEIETDKATVEVESPVAGELIEWLTSEGDIVPVGEKVARIKTNADTIAHPISDAPHRAAPTPDPEPSPSSEKAPSRGTTTAKKERAHDTRSKVIIPPRTRAHARLLGISEETLRRIPAPSGKLMPTDIDRFLATRETVDAESSLPQGEVPFKEYELPKQQQVLNYRLKRSVHLTIPCSITRPIDWARVQKSREVLAARYNIRPIASLFKTFAFCVSQVVKHHPKFRSCIIGETIVREFERLNLGIAVRTPDDDLVTAVVPRADALDYPTFVRTATERIERAREGHDQATSTVQLILTYMGHYGVTDAIPVVVTPAVGVLFIGAPMALGNGTQANISLTFDHRLINGVCAANFMNDIVERIQLAASSQEV